MVYIQVYKFKTGRYIRDHQHNPPHEKKLKKGTSTLFQMIIFTIFDKFKWIALFTEMNLCEIRFILPNFRYKILTSPYLNQKQAERHK